MTGEAAAGVPPPAQGGKGKWEEILSMCRVGQVKGEETGQECHRQREQPQQKTSRPARGPKGSSTRTVEGGGEGKGGVRRNNNIT